MKERNKRLARFWTKYTFLGLGFIIGGILLAIFTFWTVIGPTIGAALVILGLYSIGKTQEQSTESAINETGPPQT